MVQILLLGGHGKIAQYMTKILTSPPYSHHITSIIRDPSHASVISAISPHATPLVSSLETSTDDDLTKLMSEHDWVIWSAGAGGKGGAERTVAVDNNAARRWFDFALKSERVKKFLMVSANAARRSKAEWWDKKDIEKYKKSWEAIGTYCQAKVDADDYIYEKSRESKKEGWEDICLRPGALVDEPATGKVNLGFAPADGGIPREDVAQVAAELLQVGGAGGLWIDLVRGGEDYKEAVKRVVSERISTRPEDYLDRPDEHFV